MNKKPSTKSNSKKLTSSSNSISSKNVPKANLKKIAPSQDQIAVRAYFISEHRQQMGWAGDHLSDWIEAEQQLIEEAK